MPHSCDGKEAGERMSIGEECDPSEFLEGSNNHEDESANGGDDCNNGEDDDCKVLSFSSCHNLFSP